MPAGGAAEAALTADYNAEMVEHVARLARRCATGRSSSAIRPTWSTIRSGRACRRARVDAGTLRLRRLRRARPCDPAAPAGAAALRRHGRRFRHRRGPAAPGRSTRSRSPGERLPGLRMIVVAGPADRPGRPAGARRTRDPRVRGPPRPRSWPAATWRITHGGLTTTMTLTAHRRPFLYVPLRNHFEQNRHVRHRLDAYRAGRCLDWATLTPESLAAAMVAEIGRPVDYRPVETDGAGAGRGDAGRAALSRVAARAIRSAARRRAAGSRISAARRCRRGPARRGPPRSRRPTPYSQGGPSISRSAVSASREQLGRAGRLGQRRQAAQPVRLPCDASQRPPDRAPAAGWPSAASAGLDQRRRVHGQHGGGEPGVRVHRGGPLADAAAPRRSARPAGPPSRGAPRTRRCTRCSRCGR